MYIPICTHAFLFFLETREWEGSCHPVLPYHQIGSSQFGWLKRASLKSLIILNRDPMKLEVQYPLLKL